MKIVELNEGPFDGVKNFAGGIAGAMRAKSKDPKVAARGKAQLAKAGARKAGSKSGQKAKKKKMTGLMLGKWQDQANQFRQGGLDKDGEPKRGAPGIEPSLKNFNDWTANFMNKEGIEPFKGNPGRDRAVSKYFTTLVNQFYGKPDPEAVTTATPSTATPTAKQQMPLMIGRDAQQKALAAPSAPDNKDALAAFNSLGYDAATAKTLMKRAATKGANMNDPADIIKKGLEESLERALMSQYLLEAAGKNVHLEHIEDLVFNDGFEGAKAALTYIEQLISMLATGSGDTAKITTKWDGAPAIVCGIDPADGKFFVGTKSVFAKTLPKLVKSKKQLDEWYAEQPGLYEKLALALKHLPKLGIGNVLQGDFMFDSASLEPAAIDGEQMLTFTPNTITYATPIKSDLSTAMQRAKMGIVFHTAYDGIDVESMEASFGVDVSGLNQTKDVWYDDATYKDLTGSASLTPGELDKIAKTVAAIENTMTKIRPDKFDVVIQNKEFTKFVKPFINKLVRDGKLVGNPIAFLNDFLDFYRGKMQAEIDKIIADKGEETAAVKNRLAKIKSKEEFLEDNSNALLGVLAVYKRLVEIKLLIINKLHQVEGLGTFIKDGEGYKVTNPEGFVAVGHDGGAIKLVDRLEFSKQNFNAINAWKKE